MHTLLKSQVVFSLAAVATGFLVLFISLLSTSNTIEFRLFPGNNRQKPLSALLSSEILPGNPAYLFVAARDWYRIFSAQSDGERLALYIAYADRRLSNAEKLLKLRENARAVTSVSKAELYLGRAVDLLETQPSLMGKETLLHILSSHYFTMYALRTHLTDAERSQVDAMMEYNALLRQRVAGIEG